MINFHPFTKSLSNAIFLACSIFVFLLIGTTNLNAQYTILYNDAASNPLPTDDVSVCQDEVFNNTARIIVASNAADNATITITFPPGMSYVPGCISIEAPYKIGELDISDLTMPVFNIEPTDLSAGDEFVIEYCRVGDCDATEYQMLGGTFKDIIEVCGDAGCVIDDNMNLNSYDLLTPSVSLAGEGPITAAVGENVCRDVTLTNGGLGYLDSLKFYIVDGPGTATTSLTTLAGTVLTPILNGDTLCYWLTSVEMAEIGKYGWIHG